MAYTYDYKSTKYEKESGAWKKLSAWGSADNVELSFANSNLPAAFGSAADVAAFFTQIDTYFGQANGFATLGADAKLPSAQLPSSVANGGMNFIGGLDAGQDIETIMNAQIGGAPVAGDEGKFFIVTTAGDLLNATADSAHHQMQAPGDEGDSTFPITLEAGDWLVLLEVDEGTPLYTWGIIDNDYLEATAAAFGVVRLSDVTDVASLTGNDVITEGILSGLIAASDGLLTKTVGSWNTVAGLMKTNGDGSFTVDTSTYLTSYEAISEVLTGYAIETSQIDVNSSDTILQAFQKLAYTAQEAFGWGDHSLAGYQVAGNAVGINEADSVANADSELLTFNYRDGSAVAQTLQVRAEGDDGKLHYGGSALNDMPIPGVKVSGSLPQASDGNDGDIWLHVTA